MKLSRFTSTLLALTISFIGIAANSDIKAVKAVQKQTRELEKSGWTTLGAPILEQIGTLHDLTAQTDGNGNQIYLTSSATAEGCSIREAKEKSESLAFATLSELLSSTLEASSVSMMSSSGVEVSQSGKSTTRISIRKTITLLSIYRETDTGYEVRTVLAVDTRNL